MIETSTPSTDLDTLVKRVRPRRHITGMSALLLPFKAPGEVDWQGFEAHLGRTLEAGLTPALNMDTGYAQLIDDATRRRVLEIGAGLAPSGFVAGAFVADSPGSRFDPDAYARSIAQVARVGGTPIVFPSWGLAALEEAEWLEAHRGFGELCDGFIAFELGQAFVPYGRILSLEAYEELIKLGRCRGAKHSSLSRELEWQRLALRDATRAEFMVLSGNDLAIDMVMYGSDYLLGLATFAPGIFARRDRLWEAGDVAFYELNDRLQYLGSFAFRAPVPAYKHSAAQFLHLCGLIASPLTHPGAPSRPDSDVAVLREIASSLGLGV